MNPKPASLDPKLKEVYDRVMGQNTTPPSTATPPASIKPNNAPVANTTTTTVKETLPPLPDIKPQPASITSDSDTMQSAVDYAGLAAKYTNPVAPSTTPSTTPVLPTPPTTNTTTTTTSFGVVNAGNKTDEDDEAGKSGGMKTILIISGLVLFFIIYAFVWALIFNFQIPFLA